MSKTNIYHNAVVADAALNALGRDPTDDEAEACAATILEACRTIPDPLAGIVDLASAVLTIEGYTLEPVIRDVFESIQDAANKLAN